MNITLDEVLKLPPDQPCKKTLQVFILDKGSMSSYGKDKCVATVNRAEATKAMNGSVHDIDNYNMMTKDKGVLIQDFIPKNDHIVINKMTKIFLCKAPVVPDAIKKDDEYRRYTKPQKNYFWGY